MFAASSPSISLFVLAPRRNNTTTTRNKKKSSSYKTRITTNIAPDGKGCAETAGAEMKVGRPIATAMRQKITEALKPSVLEIIDESWQHAGHSGNPSGDASAETHFVLEVVSKEFEGLNQVKRQRKVYALLEEEFNEKGLHALQMKTKTPEEWEKMNK
jgi:BolA protein